MTFDDAMTVHVMRAVGVTFSEICRTVRDHSSRVTQVLDGTLHPGSWTTALEHLARDEYWHPAIAALVQTLGGPGPLILATKAADPASRRYQQTLKRLRKGAIPFSRQAGWIVGRKPRPISF